MDPELLKLIREVLDKGLAFGLWVVLFGGCLGAGVGAFVGSYLKKSGELRALDERFDSMTEQLKTQTAATERIKADFAKDIASFTESTRAESSEVLELLKHSLSQQDEDRTRRIEIRLRYRSRQIEELYGPLSSLIEQIFNVWRVRERILKGKTFDSEDLNRIRNFFWERYFTPLHQEIAGLLKTKLYLLEGGQLPTSFQQYLEHATQESCQQHLWRELQIDTLHARGLSWPQQFHTDVQEMLSRLMAEQQSGLAELRKLDSAGSENAAVGFDPC